MAECARLCEEIQKKRRAEKEEEGVLRSLRKDLDLRDRWAGIREFKKAYTHIPYTFRNADGNRIRLGERAEGAATFLEKQFWGKNRENPDTRGHYIIENYFKDENGEILLSSILSGEETEITAQEKAWDALISKWKDGFKL